MESMDGTTWYTTKETADLLGLSDETIRRHIRLKLFPNARRKSPLPKSGFIIPEKDILNYRAASKRLR